MRNRDMKALYHYCSTESFHAIVESHSVWLSSLSLSNDTMEGRLVAEVIARLAGKDSLQEDAIRRLQDSVETIEHTIDGLGFCLSEEADLLSQWRGYAANGTGVAIGFSPDYLVWLAEKSKGGRKTGFTLEKVAYHPSEHESLVGPTYREVEKIIASGTYRLPIVRRIFDERRESDFEQLRTDARKANQRISLKMLELFGILFRLKSYAFREECESRLLSYVFKGAKNQCLYRAARDRIIPYCKIDLLELERRPIAEVILGPKHLTPRRPIEEFLKRNQYGVVPVRRSAASYRG